MIPRKTDGWAPTVGLSSRAGKAGPSRVGGTLRWAWAFLLLCAGGAVSPVPGSAQQVPPDEDWRTISTPRARITFPVRMEALGRRAAYRTEVALSALERSFLALPRGTIDVLLTDHADVSNGFAQVTPSNRVTIYARPPVDEPGLGYFDDWLDLVLTHELAHIVHLDHAGTSVGKVLRRALGRVPGRWPFFPGHGTPRWVTEGLATWYESSLTDAGRVEGTFHEMQIRTAVLEDRFESVGSASGASPVWPAGNRPYAYGSLFFEYLLDRYGEDRMAAFAEAIAGQWVPYRLDAAGRKAFGVSISEAWSAWGDSLEARFRHLDEELAEFGPVTEPVRVTSGARWAVEPVELADGTLAYVRSDGRSDTRLVLESTVEGGHDGSVRVNGIASFDPLGGGRFLVGQLDQVGPYRLLSDLHVVGADGSSRRVTEGARLSQPSAGPDGSWAVAVQEGGGTSRLVRVDVATGEVAGLSGGDGREHWAHPAVSPDGTLVAATRWSPGGFHDVVVLDARTGQVRSDVTRDRALDLEPTWSPDGRWLVWTSDRTGILNVLAAPVDPSTGGTGALRLLTNVRTGVAFPSVDPTGTTLWMTVYGAEGWEVARTPFDPGGAPAAPVASARFTPTGTFLDGSYTGSAEPYSAWPTLLPRYWKPLFREPVRVPEVRSQGLLLRERELLGWAVGAQTGGRDLLGRHAYDAFGRVFTTGGKMDGGVTYRYGGLGNPLLTLGAAQFWDDDGVRLGQRDPSAPPDTLFVLERERSAWVAGTVLAPRWRRDMLVDLRAGLVDQDQELLDDALRTSSEYRLARSSVLLGDVRATVTFSTARSFAFQVGGSKGIDVYLSARARRDLSVPDSIRGMVQEDRSLDDLVGRVRAYVPLGGPGHAPHVLALQVAGGVARGPDAPGGHFEVGGASGRPEILSGLSLFGGTQLFFPVRGYDTESRVGRRAWAASGEYRFPIKLVHRGLGAWPLYVGRVVGSLFVDAGDAWDPGASEAYLSSARDPLVAVGAEIGAELVALYDFPFFTRIGLAYGFAEPAATRVYLRLGVSF